MSEFFINLYNDLAAVFSARIGLLDILDIIIVTIIIYLILRITKETRARQVLKGLGIVIIIAVITSWLRLSVISWLLSMLLQWGVLIAVILFQPELRRMLEQLGRGTFFDPKAEKHQEDNALCIDEMIRAIHEPVQTQGRSLNSNIPKFRPYRRYTDGYYCGRSYFCYAA